MCGARIAPSEAAAWRMTPKRLFAWCDIIRRDRIRGMVETVHVHSVVNGDEKDRRKQLIAWDREI